MHITVALTLGLICPQAQSGTVTVPLQNVTPTCLNVNTKDVDFWVLSARVPKHQSWITTTHGVGARVDVKLSGPGENVSYPAAAAIRTSDQGGDIVRASLRLHVLALQNLWDTSDQSTPIKTTDVSLPITFVRRQGSSNTVKVIQALINFTNNVGSSSIIPPNPYVKGAQLAGQLFNEVIGVFQPDPNEVVDPNFSLAFSLTKADTGCSAVDLQDGIGAEIEDCDDCAQSPNIIKTADIANYCFYKTGNDADPDIGFKAKTSGSACPSVVPNDLTVLNNPQFIWLAAGRCKSDRGCSSTPAPSQEAARIASTLFKENSSVLQLIKERLGSEEAHRLETVISGERSERSQLQALGRGKSVINYLNLCKSVGINPEQCLSKKFAPQSDTDHE